MTVNDGKPAPLSGYLVPLPVRVSNKFVAFCKQIIVTTMFVHMPVGSSDKFESGMRSVIKITFYVFSIEH